MAKQKNPPKAGGGTGHLPAHERAKRRVERARRRVEAEEKSEHSVSDRSKAAAALAESKVKQPQPSQPKRAVTTASKLPGARK